MKKMISLLLMCILLFSSCGNESTNRSSSIGSTISITPSQTEISSTIGTIENSEVSMLNQEEVLILKKHADILSIHLMNSIRTSSLSDPSDIIDLTDVPTDEDILRFLIFFSKLKESLSYNYGEIYSYNDYRYKDCIYNEITYDEEKIDAMFYELLNLENTSFFQKNPLFFEKVGTTGDYELREGTDPSLGVRIKNIISSIDRDSTYLTTSFNYTYDVIGVPDNIWTNYKITYQIIHENDQIFLRFLKIENTL